MVGWSSPSSGCGLICATPDPRLSDLRGGREAADARRRAWRHLDFFEYQTVLTAEVPRVKCPEHGCHQVRVPWSEERSRYTHLFEQRVLVELRTQTVGAVAAKLIWTGTQSRASSSVRWRAACADRDSGRRGEDLLQPLPCVSDHRPGGGPSAAG